MFRARPRRARRSRYRVSHRLTRSVPAAVIAVLLLGIVVAATLTYKRFDDFMTATTGHHINAIGEIAQVVEPSPGTIAYKLKHGQRVNVLLLGRGGYENDAPYLTDSIMAVSIDPVTNRVMMLSIPRDLVVHMNLQSDSSRIWTNKINAAYEVPYTSIICCVAKQYTGINGGGLAAEHEVGKVTGLTFDRYIAIDFVAFRDMVNALGGVDVCQRRAGARGGPIAARDPARAIVGLWACQAATGHHAGDQEKGDHGERLCQGAPAVERAAEEHQHRHDPVRHEGDFRLGKEPARQRDHPHRLDVALAVGRRQPA
ncbi:MAG: hypothetical protein E6H83_10495 [Chloroflexi bacterium]|nr:MAG: hypothetical protein E6H83_10495 [Chloroflexota bacterium]